MKILIACEFSGVVRRAFRKRGHDAFSCDLEPADDWTSHHFQGDVLPPLDFGWDMLIAHPPCTFLSNSGSKHLYIGMKKENGIDPERWSNMESGAELFLKLWNAPVAKICIENPIMHGHAKAIVGTQQTQTIQPWQFGHLEQKATCLWLKGLPQLIETDNVYDEMMELDYSERAKVHNYAPGPDRWKLRSRTYEGIADAMADQ